MEQRTNLKKQQNTKIKVCVHLTVRKEGTTQAKAHGHMTKAAAADAV